MSNYATLEEYGAAEGVAACLIRAGLEVAGVELPEVKGVAFVDPDNRPAVDRIVAAFVRHVPLLGRGDGDLAALGWRERLGLVMKRRGVSQYALAKATGITQPRLSLWLGPRRTGQPDLRQWGRICEALDYPLHAMIDGGRESPARQPAATA